MGTLSSARDLLGTGNAPQSPIIASRATGKGIIDLRPSHGLASGLKRSGGRNGFTRLGRSTRENLGKLRKGAPVIAHKY